MFMLNGIKTYRFGNTIFVPLPKELWRLCDGCICRYCSADGHTSNPDAAWDTLAVSTLKHDTYTWVVHAPEFHGAKPKGGKG